MLALEDIDRRAVEGGGFLAEKTGYAPQLSEIALQCRVADLPWRNEQERRRSVRGGELGEQLRVERLPHGRAARPLAFNMNTISGPAAISDVHRPSDAYPC
jgi:hypothetical protein